MKPRLLLLLILMCLQSAIAESYPDGPEVGQMAPALNITNWLQAPAGTASTWPTGKVVILEFWATWCGPCVGTIPHLNELSDAFKDKPVQFIAVTAQQASEVQPFLSKTPTHAWTGLSPDAGFGEDKPYRLEAIPHTVIIDAHGRIAGILDPRSLTTDMIDRCLAGDPLPQANEPGGEKVPGVVPGEYRLGEKPLFQVLIRPNSTTNIVDTWSDHGVTFQPDQLKEAICRVFDVTGARIVEDAPLSQDFYDFYISLPEPEGKPPGKAMLQAVFAQAVQAAFGLSVKKEMHEVEVYVLRTNANSAAALAVSSDNGRPEFWGWGELTATNRSLDYLAGGLEHSMRKPVIDKTGLTNHYSYNLTWNQKDRNPNPEGMVAAVKKLGLELVKTNQPLEVVVVASPTNSIP